MKLVYSKNRKFAYILNSISSTIACYSVKHNKFTLIDEVMTYSKDEYDGVNTPMDMVITENGIITVMQVQPVGEAVQKVKEI